MSKRRCCCNDCCCNNCNSCNNCCSVGCNSCCNSGCNSFGMNSFGGGCGFGSNYLLWILLLGGMGRGGNCFGGNRFLF
ncbi:MAG: hypothetical protein ACRDD2_10100 [Sarcina sp.]